jgi:hypothetical protein
MAANEGNTRFHTGGRTGFGIAEHWRSTRRGPSSMSAERCDLHLRRWARQPVRHPFDVIAPIRIRAL